MEPVINHARLLAARTVHVKIHPTARNLSERREVLRVLERFGEVVMFRSLKYSPRSAVPNAFLSIFNTEAAATDVINASPIRYRLITEKLPPTPPVIAFPGFRAASDAVPSSAVAAASKSDKSGAEGGKDAGEQPPTEQERIFELNISPSNFNHLAYVTSPITNPLHGPWVPVMPKHSYTAAALDRVLPRGVARRGLIDWETGKGGGRGGRVLGLGVDGEGEDEGWGKDVGGGFSVEQKVRQREMRRREKGVLRAMQGLKALREEWERKQRTDTPD